LTKSVAPKPWEPAIATQDAQIDALCAQVSILREELQRFRRAEVVNAGSNPVPYCVSPSQTSTIGNTKEDFLMMVEDNIIDPQEQRVL